MAKASEATDGEVLRLRSRGQAFAKISRVLEFERPKDAEAAFQRALRRLPTAEQALVKQEETSRLDRMTARVEADMDRTPEDRARRLVAIERLRGLLLT
jgi:hypothetical protein